MGRSPYSETTTKDSIFKEDANRCLQINTNPSATLTKRVLRVQGQQYLPGPEQVEAVREQVKQRHQDFQCSLKYLHFLKTPLL